MKIEDQIQHEAFRRFPIYIDTELVKYNHDSETSRKDFVEAAMFGFNLQPTENSYQILAADLHRKNNLLELKINGYLKQLATDGREELEKENAKLKKGIIGDLAPHIQELIPDHVKALEKQITALQSSLKEKEKECEELKSQKARAEMSNEGMSLELEFQSKQIEELKAENEKLIMLTRKLMIGGS